MNILEFIYNLFMNMINSAGIFAPILSSLLILIESIVPVLPLSLFITINAVYLGSLTGFIISYVFTILGCYLSFKLCNNYLKKYYDRVLNKKEHKRIKKFMNGVNKLSLEKLTIVIAIPFTPAFLVNIACGLANVDEKKFAVSLFIGKIFLVLFWQFIGTSLIESIKNPLILIKVIIMLIGAFIISKIINKKYRLE